MNSFTINVPFEKLRITDEELAKRQELIKKHTKNGKVDLFLVFNEFYEWLSKKGRIKMKIRWNSHDVNLTAWTVKRKSDGKYLQHDKNGDLMFCDSPYKYHMTLDQVKQYMTNKYVTCWADKNCEFQHKLHDPQLNVNDFEFTECGADSWTYMIVKNEKDLPKHRYDIVGE